MSQVSSRRDRRRVRKSQRHPYHMPPGARNAYRKKTMHRMHARPLYAPVADSHDGAHVHAAGNGIDDLCPASAANRLDSLCSPHATLPGTRRDEQGHPVGGLDGD